ncbi:MAG: carbon starvation protein A, partial [Nitrospirae bacterium]|nr:carbon starvation protein A [Nitrospirota bacterium]
MNVALLILLSVLLYVLAYRFYAGYIAKVFDESDRNITPATELMDGWDYVPTKTPVVFSHHFASIAGAGPVIGPTVALIYGYLPVWLWIILGTIFIGAVHDFSAMFASLREKGKSMARIGEKSLGKTGFLLFISFTILMLLLVTSAFLNLTAVALTSLVPVEAMGLPEQTIIKTKVVDDKLMAQIGGIASTSVIVITCLAPIMGFLLYRKGISIPVASLLSIGICSVSIPVGLAYPVSIDFKIWMVIISVYTLVAAGIPVWMMLQPRDFINSFLLYAGVFALIGGGIISGLQGTTVTAPAMNITEGSVRLGPIWPMLFITVACGAISGFHSLVAGGTTSKQLSKETDCKKVGYGAMILEGLFAIGVLIAVSSGLDYKQYLEILFPSIEGARSNPVLGFSLGMGGLLQNTFGLPVYIGTIFGILLLEGFVITTLDTAVRLNRYLLEELWGFIFKNPPEIFKTYIFNAFICVLLMFLLAYYNAFLVIWPIFGTANQL